MTGKFIKLINNERVNKRLTAAKACDSTSFDNCEYEDYAGCVVYSYDYCGKDHAACFNHMTDICAARDVKTCVGYSEDYETEPYNN